MRLIGLDAGTTSVSGVLLNTETGLVEEMVSVDHEAMASTDIPGMDIQDPERLYKTLERTRQALLDAAEREQAAGNPGDVSGLSITGQVHGILYLDEAGSHASPLYTWQDTRGREPREPGTSTSTWSDWATHEAGYWIPPGYGFLTHLINQGTGNVPHEATGMTTLLGYLSMRLTGATRSRLDQTDAHSLGVFNVVTGAFDYDALQRLGVERRFVPEIVQAGTKIGLTREGIPVYAAVGDNQAGYIGSVRDCRGTLLVSIGTSAQLSAFTASLPESGMKTDAFPGWNGALEVRPYPGGGYLLSGASISGGSAYRLLEKLFRNICRTYGSGDPGPLLEQMNRIPFDELDDGLRLDVNTQFLGTRKDPARRGTINGITPSNFTPDYLVDGFLRGIVAEVNGFYNDLRNATGDNRRVVVGVGNALRRNPLLREILQRELELPVTLPVQREEAALGAAIVAGVGAGIYENYVAPDRPIRYEDEGKRV